MQDEDKTREQLMEELVELRNRVSELEMSSYRWLDWTSVPVPEERLFYSTARDAAGENLAGEKLQASEHLFRTSIENMLDCFVIYTSIRDSNGKIIDFRHDYVNESMCRTINLTKDQLIGKGLLELFPGQIKIGLFAKYCDVVETGRPSIIESVDYDQDGLNLSIEIRITKIGDGFLSSWRDITERKLSEQAIRLSEERFSKAFNSSPNPMAITSENGNFIDVNDSFERIYGYNRDEVIGRSAIELNIWAEPDNRNIMIQLLNEYGSVRNLEVKFAAKTGKIGVGLLSAEVIHLSNNKCILVVVNDITERKQAEEELRLSEERFFKAFHNNPTPMAIVRFDDDKHIDINKGFELALGYSREETIGHAISDLNIYVDIDIFRTYKQLLLEHGHVHNLNLFIRTKFGAVRSILLSGVIIELNGENCRLMVINDITDFKKMETEIARLDRLNLIGEMAAGISHEIRNPLTTVRGFLQLLGEKEAYAQGKTYFDLMIEELDRANSIITEFLSLARNKAVNKKVQNLNKIIEALLPLIQADAIKSDKNVLTKLGDIPDLLLDDKEIRQLLLNLVRNGLDAMLPNGKLTIRTLADGENIVLAVQDEGRGIEPEILDKIGTPFFTTKDNGTGLGLAICYSIAERHNARIDIDTGETGTTLLVRFRN